MTTKYYDITSDQGVPTFQFFGQFICSLRLFHFLLLDLLDGLAKLVEFCILLCKINCLKKTNGQLLQNTLCEKEYWISAWIHPELLALPVELLSFTNEFSVFLAQLLEHILKFLGYNRQLLRCLLQLLGCSR